jgi:MarR family 2-MHQ and catechol resistance regulon transcriptional repressor
VPQTPDIPTPKLVIVFMRASRALAEFLEAGLAREGIHNPDFAILEALLHKGPLTLPALEQKVRLAAGPLKVAIERLRRRGVVQEQRAPDRRNAGGFALTEEGRTTITRVYARHAEDIETVMGVLSPGERLHLWQSLKKVGMRGERCWPIRCCSRTSRARPGSRPRDSGAHSSCPWASLLIGGR